jgi:hypothetical protein
MVVSGVGRCKDILSLRLHLSQEPNANISHRWDAGRFLIATRFVSLLERAGRPKQVALGVL